jgi:hypothetical protein
MAKEQKKNNDLQTMQKINDQVTRTLIKLGVNSDIPLMLVHSICDVRYDFLVNVIFTPNCFVVYSCFIIYLSYSLAYIGFQQDF